MENIVIEIFRLLIIINNNKVISDNNSWYDYWRKSFNDDSKNILDYLINEIRKIKTAIMIKCVLIINLITINIALTSHGNAQGPSV